MCFNGLTNNTDIRLRICRMQTAYPPKTGLRTNKEKAKQKNLLVENRIKKSTNIVGF